MCGGGTVVGLFVCFLLYTLQNKLFPPDVLSLKRCRAELWEILILIAVPQESRENNDKTETFLSCLRLMHSMELEPGFQKVALFVSASFVLSC